MMKSSAVWIGATPIDGIAVRYVKWSWNTGTSRGLAGEDMPRKPLDIPSSVSSALAEERAEFVMGDSPAQME